MSRVLLADDSPHAQRMGERILAEEGYEVVSVTDGDAAVESFLAGTPDVVIVDAYLPGRSGFDLCRWIKDDPSRARVGVVLTAGMIEPFDQDAAREAGADATLRKPFEASIVITVVRALAVSAQDAARASAPATVTAAPVLEPATESIDSGTPFDSGLPAPDEAGAEEQVEETPAPYMLAGDFAALPADVSTVVASENGDRVHIDPELVRAAVTVALDAAMPALIDEVTSRVMAALAADGDR